MSALSALILGVCGLGMTGIVAGSGILLYTLSIANNKTSDVLGLVEHTFDGLPELIESMPPIVSDALSDRRAPEYAGHVDIEVGFVPDSRGDYLRPSLIVKNNGDQTLTFLAVRVAAIGESGRAVEDWTEVIATPIAIEHDWRGPLMPGNTRYVTLRGSRRLSLDQAERIRGAVEITDVRVWDPTVRKNAATAGVISKIASVQDAG
jgi:hypothetical protein